MKLSFLGGADEIGASCTLITNGDRHILVDCGIRMAGSDVLPHLAAIGSLDAILVTHAHMDHSGALPVIHEAFPDVPVLATAPTAALLRVMLGDSLKLMESRAEAEGEVPLYGPAAVHSLLANIRKVPLLDPVPLDETDVIAQFFPAGHILGAAAIGISGPEGQALVTGDIAVSDQLTVPGMIAPRFEPDVVVVESTYGDRLHASRKAEEQHLVALIGETLAAGGKVLVPAFALGRAQEVLLILKRAFAKRELEPLPVYADGMVRSICEVYVETLVRLCRESTMDQEVRKRFFGELVQQTARIRAGTGRQVDLFPPAPAPPPGQREEPVTVELFSLDLSDPDDFDRAYELFCTGQLPKKAPRLQVFPGVRHWI